MFGYVAHQFNNPMVSKKPEFTMECDKDSSGCLVVTEYRGVKVNDSTGVIEYFTMSRTLCDVYKQIICFIS